MPVGIYALYFTLGTEANILSVNSFVDDVSFVKKP